MAIELLLKGGTLVTEGGVVQADVGIDKEKIVALTAPGETVPAKRVVDIGGLHLLPGLIDMHSHHREPGYTHKEDLITATACCAAGGVTVTVGMPNVSPSPTTAEILRDMFALYDQKAIVDYNVNPAGTVLEEIPRMAAMGILAYKVFMVVDTGRSYPHMPGIGVHDHGKLLAIFQEVQKTGLPIMIHPHDQALMDQIEQGYWAEGKRDFRAYAQAYAAHDGVIWDVAVGVLLRLQQAAGVRLHLLHLQTTGCVEMLRAAKAQGRPVSAEVNPWALWLGNDWSNIERLGSYALSYYVAPHHSEAIWKALLDGTADIIATDHAPHLKEEKEPGWTDGWKAHTGTPSAQRYLSLLLTDVSAGRISLERAVEIVSLQPAKLFGLYPRKGAIRVGADADLVAVDLDREHVITNEEVLSKCGWTPYAGRKVRGVPVHTLVRGQFVFENGSVVGRPGYGRLASPVHAKSHERK
ncbi:MAG: dihydroorotase family protein [Acidobacteria bacterium]|nr:dihydroorotase family protein [Acidobacteriota bacterium]